MRAHLQSGPEGEGGPAPPQVAATYLPGRAAYPAALCAGALPGRPATARRPRRYRPLAAFARARLGRAMVAAVVVLFPLWLLAAASTPAGAQEPPVICIDPGHPSEVNPGFTVQNGTTETHIDWVVARELEKLLSQKGFRVVMTKSREKQFVRNKERALIANRAGAAIMVRLHCDSSSSRGYALYYPDRTGTKEGMTGPSEDVRSRSHRAAETLAKAMRRELEGRLPFAGVKGDSKTFVGGKQGALTGSIFSRVPVVTIEMVVLSSRADAAFIKRPDGQAAMARAIADGIEAFVGGKHPDEGEN